MISEFGPSDFTASSVEVFCERLIRDLDYDRARAHFSPSRCSGHETEEGSRTLRYRKPLSQRRLRKSLSLKR